jgi:hypothetical protein
MVSVSRDTRLLLGKSTVMIWPGVADVWFSVKSLNEFLENPLSFLAMYDRFFG